MSDADDRLRRYREKRSAGRTPEPFGGEGVEPGGHLFVFHKHRARNLHWDLRLELDGVLESWAVPKGPSPNPDDKRLAVHVEPHPLDYADFEGVIPEGEYGAGPSIVWDRGVWVPLEDPREGLETGKLLFELRGFKVRGVWTLVHTPKSGENHWLLIKELGDAYVDREGGTESYADDSIYSGFDVEELPDQERAVGELVERAREAGAQEGAPRAADIQVMKATRHEEPFDDPDWVFEIKYDGYRLLAERRADDPSDHGSDHGSLDGRHHGSDRSGVLLLSRNGNDLTATFPEIARAVRKLPWPGILLDGEVVVHDETGLPSFGRLQRRGRLQNRRDIQRAALELPATLYAFDLLALDDLDLRGLPLTERKALLREILPTVGPIRYSDHVPEKGTAVFEQVTAMELEGVVAKRADAPYRAGRSDDWRKIRTVRTDDFVVVGWTDPKGSRAGFGALHLAQYRGRSDPELVWMGSVGTGFTDARIVELAEELEALAAERADLPLVAPEEAELPRKGAVHWVRPKLVVEVRYREVTEAGVLRHPSFLRVRDEKEPEACRWKGDHPDALPEPPEVEPAPEKRTVHFTNRDKVFWPDEEHARSKGDLIDYYDAVWEWIAPYLADRPLVLTRFPDGIDGKSFYQKDAPVWAPEWIRTVSVWSESGEKELSYFVAEDRETLLYLANLGTIPLHIWHSRTRSIARPDWCLLDLDPKEAPFEHVVRVALFLHELCDEIGLPHYVKTSGSSGLHVMIPLGRALTYDQSKALGQLLATLATRALPEIATVERVVRKREGKVYVDFLQNRHGQLVAAPFCVRARPGATVSAPLRWHEVGPSLSLADYTIDSVPRRMRALEEGDPLLPVLTDTPDLLDALERLKAEV